MNVLPFEGIFVRLKVHSSVNITSNYRKILANQLCCVKHVKHCWGVYGQKSIVNSVGVDCWTAELAIIASNVVKFLIV